MDKRNKRALVLVCILFINIGITIDCLYTSIRSADISNRSVEMVDEIKAEAEYQQEIQKCREQLIHETVEGVVVTGLDVQTFIKYFKNEYTIEVRNKENQVLDYDEIKDSYKYKVSSKEKYNETYRYVYEEQ